MHAPTSGKSLCWCPGNLREVLRHYLSANVVVYVSCCQGCELVISRCVASKGRARRSSSQLGPQLSPKAIPRWATLHLVKPFQSVEVRLELLTG